MTKIVYNACFGGFGLSYDAVMEYAKRKGFKLYCGGRSDSADFNAPYVALSRADVMGRGRVSFHSFFKSPDLNWDSHFADKDIPRDDPDLVAIVEGMGAKANSGFSNLQIAEVRSGNRYRIDEYDGNESVMTQDDYEWSVA